MPASNSPRVHPDSDMPLHKWLARLSDALSMCPDERYKLVSEAIRNLANEAQSVEAPGSVLDVATFKAQLAALKADPDPDDDGWRGTFNPAWDDSRYAINPRLDRRRAGLRTDPGQS